MSRPASISPKNPLPADLSSSIDDALAGLDRAEQLRDDGRCRYSEAMELYEGNIGALIGHLKSIPETNSSIDTSVLADRLRVALSDAEAIKHHLSDAGAGGPLTKDTRIDRRPSSSPTSRLSSAFSSMIGIGKSHSYEDNNIKTQQTKKDYDYAHASSMRNLSPKNQNENEMPDVSPTAATIQPPRQQSSNRRKRSNLNYAASDPLVQVVKTELYVDKSQLTTRWDDVVGLVSAKRAMQEAAILPMIRPDLYTGLRSPPKGVLLYGPPGTGKTMLVRAAAKESKCILFSCTASALTSKWHGEGEKLLRTLFAVAIDAAPSMIFFDEIDALLESRKGGGNEHEASRRFKTEFMVQMDGIVSGNPNGDDDVCHRVLVLGCSNCPWDIDDAVMRRMSRRIYVKLPDGDARRFLLDKLLSKESGRHSLSKKQIESIVDQTEGFSCSDISAIAQEAAFGPLRDLGSVSNIENCNPDDIRWINKDDFDEALANTKRSVSNDLMKRYKAWEDQQGVR